MYDNSGLATSLIGALVGEALEGGAGGGGGREGVSELAGLLQAGAPDYFKEQDKVFYQVGGGRGDGRGVGSGGGGWGEWVWVDGLVGWAQVGTGGVVGRVCCCQMHVIPLP